MRRSRRVSRRKSWSRSPREALPSRRHRVARGFALALNEATGLHCLFNAEEMEMKMKAIRVHEFGGPEVLKLEEVTTPKPSAGQVLVRIHATGVNPADTYMRTGTYALKPPLPYTPGSDSAGVIEAVGDGVKKVKRGDRVYTAKTLTG